MKLIHMSLIMVVIAAFSTVGCGKKDENTSVPPGAVVASPAVPTYPGGYPGGVTGSPGNCMYGTTWNGTSCQPGCPTGTWDPYRGACSGAGNYPPGNYPGYTCVVTGINWYYRVYSYYCYYTYGANSGQYYNGSSYVSIPR